MECNRPEAAIVDQLSARHHFLTACDRTEVDLPNVREVKTLGILGHGHQCRGEFAQAEQIYRQAIGKWQMHRFRTRPDIWELGLTLSLIFQSKFSDAETILDSILDERAAYYGLSDTRSTMYVSDAPYLASHVDLAVHVRRCTSRATYASFSYDSKKLSICMSTHCSCSNCHLEKATIVLPMCVTRSPGIFTKEGSMARLGWYSLTALRTGTC